MQQQTSAFGTAAADGSSVSGQQPRQQQPWELQQQVVELDQLAEGEVLPAGPVFDTSMPGDTWVEAAAAAEIAAAEAAAAEAAAAAAAAAAAEVQPPSDLQDVATAAATPGVAAAAVSTPEAVQMQPTAAAAPATLAPPGSSTSSTKPALGSIHERVEQLEQEHKQQQEKQRQKKGSKRKEAMKPRATGREGRWVVGLV